MGRSDEALKEIFIAVELDPISRAILKDQAMAFYYTRQYDKAIDKALIALNLDPDFITLHRLLSLCYQGNGMFEQAIMENKLWGVLTGNEEKLKWP